MKPIYFFEIFSSESHPDPQLSGRLLILSKFPHNDVREHLSSWMFWSFCSMFRPVVTLTSVRSPRIFGHFLEHFNRTSVPDRSSWHKNNRFEHQWRCETAVSELTVSILFIVNSLWNPNIVSTQSECWNLTLVVRRQWNLSCQESWWQHLDAHLQLASEPVWSRM